MTGGGAVRCFIALEIPGDVRGYLGAVIARLRTAGADAKWVEPDNIHLTLKFLGECPPHRIEAAAARLDGARGKYHRPAASLEALGVFPDRQRPQVVWAGLELQDGTIGKLQQEIERMMETAGFARETRAFTPHLTLGRLRSARNAGALLDLLGQVPLDRRGFASPSLALVRSELAPRGAVYRTLLSIGFE